MADYIMPKQYREQSVYLPECDDCSRFESRLIIAEEDIDQLEVRMDSAEAEISTKQEAMQRITNFEIERILNG